ncbi:MAG TPA: galactofuranose ABC transporter, permease protein YjfF [Verrucomicrobiae bacterium]|nr:galactofuranose ABC transporter, permease protein YjfF [Verrucomicrobiae bacterium]
MNALWRRQNLPFLATAFVLVALYGTFSLMFENFLSLRVINNLFINNAHVGVIAIGMTFVILSGGIDLSVGSVLAFTTIFIASLVGHYHVHPAVAIGLALIVGSLFGAGMGALIQVYGLPPFLVTLAGMFLARGLAFVISSESMGIAHPMYQALIDFGIPLTRTVTVRSTALVFLFVFAVAIYLAHFHRFGRNVYAVGGNEQSALLMGLPVARTKILVYAVSGLCSALGGVVYTLFTQSGNPLNGLGLELDAIAAVVIGGTLLSGGVGYVAGTLMGVLIYGTILTAIDFHGRLDSSWQRIAIGGLLLVFIVLQRVITGRAARS